VPAQPNASALDPLGPEAPPSAAPDPQQTRRERARRYNDHATAAMLQGQLGSALSLFGNALEADPSYPPAYRGQGLVLQQLGRPAEAVEAFRQFLRLQPNGEQSDKIRERLKSIEETHSL
jgi:Tfp pilus assembly protein PilF